MADKREGLFYCIQRRPPFPELPPLPALPEEGGNEVIMNEFLNFCMNGFKDGDGYVEDPEGGTGAMNGTINWLAGYELYHANFFTIATPTPMLLVSLLLDNGSGSGPDWTLQGGFMHFIKKGSFPIDLGKSGAVILTPQPKLDDALAAMEYIKEIPAGTKRDNLLLALKGEPRADLFVPNLGDVLKDDAFVSIRQLINSRITFPVDESESNPK